jgi:DNA mismatch repair protein MutL
MPIIQIMNEHLSNKIAAGEVVERPASVVKELVENAIDAKSTIVEVYVEEGGLGRIRVVDNGVGMDREDAIMAFERHATSKVKTDRDLFQISTLGFRGEALPSIAAVARVSLTTWNGQEDVGTQVLIQGGTIKETSDAPLRKGTIIEVNDLFYNTPARYKYLRTIHTELSHISDYMNRLALAHPAISFKLVHNGRELLMTNGNGQHLGVISAIYGYNTAKQMIPFQAKHIDFEVEGYVGQPELSRSNRHSISMIINGRYIRHFGLNQALTGAYHTRLPIHRYPVAILSIKMDPSLLDINVHPAKLEARLSKEKELIEWLEIELRRVLNQEQGIPQPLQEEKKRRQEANIQQTLHLQLPDPQVKDNSHYTQKQAATNEGGRQGLVRERDQIMERGLKLTADNEREKIPLLYPLAQLHGTYILAQNEQGLYMIDQHAAQERIWYEHFYEKLNEPIRANQELLIPIVLEFTSGEYALIHENVEQLQAIGLFLEEFGHHSYIIRSHPQWFPSGDEERLLRDMIQYITEKKGKVEWIVMREKVAIMMSCKQAIKANHHLTREEMEALLEKLRRSSNPFTCPHGRPITVLLSTYDIEKMFKRVM